MSNISNGIRSAHGVSDSPLREGPEQTDRRDGRRRSDTNTNNVKQRSAHQKPESRPNQQGNAIMSTILVRRLRTEYNVHTSTCIAVYTHTFKRTGRGAEQEGRSTPNPYLPLHRPDTHNRSFCFSLTLGLYRRSTARARLVLTQTTETRQE